MTVPPLSKEESNISSYVTTAAVALVPILIGSVVSYWMSFPCCDGTSFTPAPGLGYIRWELTLAIWIGLGLATAAIALLVTFLTNNLIGKQQQQHPLITLALIYGISVHQALIKQNSWAEQAGKYISTMQFGWDPLMRTPHDVPWVTREMEKEFEEEEYPHVRVSEEPLLSRKDCREYVQYALDHADDWMNSHMAIPPTMYAAFGGDINYGRNEINIEFRPYRPWHDRFPWLSEILPNWNYYYGFQRYLGRESAAVNQTFQKHIQTIYLQGLRPKIEKIRQGLARHFDTTPSQIVMGGDEGTVLEDFSPPSVMVGLPNYIRQWDNNYHVDSIDWGIKIIYDRLRERGVEEPCEGGDYVHAGTLALEIPSDGSGMLWWLHDDEEDEWVEYFTPYRLGYIATVPSTVVHSIAPYNYTGWFDKKRITLQMFMLHCLDEDLASMWYVFH